MWEKLYQKFQRESHSIKSPLQMKKWDTKGVVDHSSTCQVGFCWTETKLLKKEERKVREALEIQLNSSPHIDQGLNQGDGQYVKISFWKPMLAHRSKSL